MSEKIATTINISAALPSSLPPSLAPAARVLAPTPSTPIEYTPIGFGWRRLASVGDGAVKHASHCVS